VEAELDYLVPLQQHLEEFEWIVQLGSSSKTKDEKNSTLCLHLRRCCCHPHCDSHLMVGSINMSGDIHGMEDDDDTLLCVPASRTWQ
jgi:hypothetical protein